MRALARRISRARAASASREPKTAGREKNPAMEKRLPGISVSPASASVQRSGTMPCSRAVRMAWVS